VIDTAGCAPNPLWWAANHSDTSGGRLKYLTFVKQTKTVNAGWFLCVFCLAFWEFTLRETKPGFWDASKCKSGYMKRERCNESSLYLLECVHWAICIEFSNQRTNKMENSLSKENKGCKASREIDQEIIVFAKLF